MNTNASNVMAPSNGKRRRTLLLLAAVFVTAGVAYGIWWGVAGRYRVDTDDAYVSGNLIQITPRVTGTVVAVAVMPSTRPPTAIISPFFSAVPAWKNCTCG